MPAVVRDDLRVQIMTDDRPYFWHRQERKAHWQMPLVTGPGWVKSRDGLFVHVETRNILQSISGMHCSVRWWRGQGVDSVGAGVLPVPLGG